MLTLQTGLRSLTMLPWQDVLFARSLLAPVRRWCPDCYAEMRREHGECWDPLAVVTGSGPGVVHSHGRHLGGPVSSLRPRSSLG